jgi:hypothetical protein
LMWFSVTAEKKGLLAYLAIRDGWQLPTCQFIFYNPLPATLHHYHHYRNNLFCRHTSICCYTISTVGCRL